MAKKRGLAANRGLDALLGSIKKEKAITAPALLDDITDEATLLNDKLSDKLSDKLGDKESNDEDGVKLKSAKKTKPKPNDTKLKSGSIKHAPKANLGKSANLTSADLTTNNDVTVPQTASISASDEMCLIQIEVERLQAGRYQPRRDMSETALTELASSIRQHGVMQPIVIRPLLSGEDRKTPSVTHEIIAGERRWRAAMMAGETTIPAIERALSDELAIALALIENIQREDLSVIEQAEALQRFHTEFGMSHAMIADVVGKARTTVSNLLRLNHLHDTVKNYLADAQIDMGHARALLSLSLEQQPIIAEKIIDGAMTVRDAEKLVKSILNPEKTDKRKKVDIEVEKLSLKLSETVGAKVKLKQKRGGKGSIEIFFHSEDELSALLEQFER